MMLVLNMSMSMRMWTEMRAMMADDDDDGK